MMPAATRTTTRLRPFGVSIFAEMTALAEKHGAINLAQGFPDFDPPAPLVEAALRAMRAGENQYARSRGLPRLAAAVAGWRARAYGLAYDPATEVGVYSGATEGISAAILGLVEPGDEVVLVEPFYDSYPAAVALAGGVARYLTLRFPEFTLDLAALEALVGPRTRLLVLNHPHNPTGKVYTRAELEAIADLCRRRDLVVLCDEVYESLTFDGVAHLPLAALPGMRERTITLGSAGKLYSATGWKVGWATGPAPLIDAAQAAHQFLTFATATPLQAAVAHGLAELPDAYYAGMRAEFQERRDFLCGVLRGAGFQVAVPRGTYFIVADFRRLHDGDDRAFARWLVEHHGIAAIPASPFYAADPAEGQRLVRFAFCKKMETLRAAAERLAGIG